MSYKICAWHLCKNAASGKSAFCGKKCKSKFYVDRRRKKLKKMAVAYKGGKCQICGYDACLAAIDFHHLDPKEKTFGISADGHTKSWERVKAELDKCIAVCSNCHAEIHSGLVSTEFEHFSDQGHP